mgnify:CR=1 FL=1
MEEKAAAKPGSGFGEQGRDEHQGLCEDDRHHVGRIHLQRNVLPYASILLVTHDTLRILHGDLADRLHQGDRRP